MTNGRKKGLRMGLVLAVSMAPSLACLAPSDDGERVEVVRPELAASLGSYDSGATARVVYAYDGYVELRSNDGYGAVMMGLSLDEGLGSIEDGETVTGDVIGCGGPREGDWYWDRHASRVRVRAERVDARTRRVFVEAEWTDGSFAHASFDYLIPRGSSAD